MMMQARRIAFSSARGNMRLPLANNRRAGLAARTLKARSRLITVHAAFLRLRAAAWHSFGRAVQEGLGPAGSLSPVRQPVRACPPSLGGGGGRLNHTQGVPMTGLSLRTPAQSPDYQHAFEAGRKRAGSWF